MLVGNTVSTRVRDNLKVCKNVHDNTHKVRMRFRMSISVGQDYPLC